MQFATFLFFTASILLCLQLIQGQTEAPACENGETSYEHPNCTLFYQCVNGIPELNQCPGELFYNPLYGICDFPEHVPECVDGTRAPLPSTTPITTVPTTPTSPPTTSEPSNDTDCGTILTAPSGILSYKPETPYNNGERCVWTIAVPGAVSFLFESTEYGIDDTNDGVLVTSLIRDGRQYFNLTTSKLDPLASPQIALEGNVAIIIFYSDSTTISSGFELSYEVTVNSSQVYNSTHAILSRAPMTNISHPDYVGDNYSPQELSTFVYSPRFSTLNSEEIIKSTFILREIEGLCYDTVSAYTLVTDDVSGIPSWTLHETFCQSTPWYSFNHNDITLFVFRSDPSAQFNGFMLEFSVTSS